ncbi:hypothetical protein MVES_000126 [Malassezia vespertilionis]|uniref:Uncharacterized protein n=1 Tax=Malassezia vespertilionis TaxID=2020962 RepID=A0A2N1JFS9_9BASI|nr:hypothetical protein MVES_000126 [Malassezia vespertilionis]
MTSPMEMDKLLHVAQSCAPPEAIQLIVQVTEDPHTHTFAKLAEAPTIQKLALTPEGAPYVQLLRLYTTGTWADYLSMAHQLPSLSAAQVAKLRQLTILSLAYQERSLSYATMS